MTFKTLDGGLQLFLELKNQIPNAWGFNLITTKCLVINVVILYWEVCKSRLHVQVFTPVLAIIDFFHNHQLGFFLCWSSYQYLKGNNHELCKKVGYQIIK